MRERKELGKVARYLGRILAKPPILVFWAIVWTLRAIGYAWRFTFGYYRRLPPGPSASQVIDRLVEEGRIPPGPR